MEIWGLDGEVEIEFPEGGGGGYEYRLLRYVVTVELSLLFSGFDRGSEPGRRNYS